MYSKIHRQNYTYSIIMRILNSVSFCVALCLPNFVHIVVATVKADSVPVVYQLTRVPNMTFGGGSSWISPLRQGRP